MRTWLSARKAGGAMPATDYTVSALRTVAGSIAGGAQKMNVRKSQGFAATKAMEALVAKDLDDLQHDAAAEGNALKRTLERARMEQPRSLQRTMYPSAYASSRASFAQEPIEDSLVEDIPPVFGVYQVSVQVYINE